MSRMRRIAPFTRFLLTVLFTLCVGVRLLTPIGFMPSFAGGSLAIVECPVALGAPAPAEMPGMDMPGKAMPHGHQHDESKVFHQPCPYAEAASLAGLEFHSTLVALLVLFAALAPLARVMLAVSRRATRERPPSQGPPLPA
jgi:hypothetical protein